MKKYLLILFVLLFVIPLPSQWQVRNDYYLTNNIEHGCLSTYTEKVFSGIRITYRVDGGECHQPEGITDFSIDIGILPHLDKYPNIFYTWHDTNSYMIAIEGFVHEEIENGYVYNVTSRAGIKTFNVAYSLWEFDWDTIIFYSCPLHTERIRNSTDCDIGINFYPFEIKYE